MGHGADMYALLKQSGLCVQCKQENPRKTAYCPTCSAAQVAKNKARWKKWLAANALKKAARIACGLCQYCGERELDLDRNGCKPCVDRVTASSSRRRVRKTGKRRKCLNCGVEGHIRRTCPTPLKREGITIADYATARRNWDF